MVRQTILIMDNEPTSLQAICETIKGFGYSCICCESAAKTRTLLDFVLPELIVLDLDLIEEDEMKLIKGIQTAETPSHIPIIAMCGCKDCPDEPEILKAGVNVYLRKPFGVEELKGTIDRLLA